MWICPKVKEWVDTINTLKRFSVRYLHTAYYRLAMSLQAEWQSLMQSVTRVGEYMVPVEEDLANKFLPKLMGLESI